VAHSLSAKKRVRQNARRKALNHARKAKVKSAIKGFHAAAAGTGTEAAEKQLRRAAKRIDQSAAAGTIHKRTAARRKSQLARHLNEAVKKNAPED